MFFNSRKKSEYTVKTACVAQQQNMYVHIQKCGWLTNGHRGFTRRSRPSAAWKGWCWMTHRWAGGLGEHSVCKTVVDLQLPEKPGEDKKKYMSHLEQVHPNIFEWLLSHLYDAFCSWEEWKMDWIFYSAFLLCLSSKSALYNMAHSAIIGRFKCFLSNIGV